MAEEEKVTVEGVETLAVEGKAMSAERKVMEEKWKVLEEEWNMTKKEIKAMEEQWKAMAAEGKVTEEERKAIEEELKAIAAEGQVTAEKWNVIEKKLKAMSAAADEKAMAEEGKTTASERKAMSPEWKAMAEEWEVMAEQEEVIAAEATAMAAAEKAMSEEGEVIAVEDITMAEDGQAKGQEGKAMPFRADAEDRVRAIWLRDETEKALHIAVKMAEVATEMRVRARTGERTLHELRRLSVDSRRALSALSASGQDWTLLGAHTARAALRNLESCPSPHDVTLNNLRHDYDKLLHLLHVERSTTDTRNVTGFNLAKVKDKITYLEQMQKSSQRGLRHLESSLSPSHSRNPSDFDEKYPDLPPRASLIDLDHISALQTVPEDAFVSSRRPLRSSSLCSLKNLRRLMKTLQRAEGGGGGTEERGEGTHGDMEVAPSHLPSAKSVRLGDIKEELPPE